MLTAGAVDPLALLAASTELEDEAVEEEVASTIVDSAREEEAMAGCDWNGSS